MRIWKPLTRYKKHRKEWAWHCDFALEKGDVFEMTLPKEISLPDGKGLKEICPKGQILKIHLEICVEPFVVKDK